MKRTNILFKAVSLICFFFFVTSCNEDLVSDTINTDPPVITNFSPKLGKVGTEITIKGTNLLQIDSVTFGGGQRSNTGITQRNLWQQSLLPVKQED